MNLKKRTNNRPRKIRASFLTDKHGTPSSKRLVGVSLMLTGAIISIILTVFALFSQGQDNEIVLNVLQALFVAGCGLLGIGIVDNKS